MMSSSLGGKKIGVICLLPLVPAVAEIDLDFVLAE